jgi:hypothetical protein
MKIFPHSWRFILARKSCRINWRPNEDGREHVQGKAFLQRFSAAKRAGFDGIELQFPYEESPDALHRAATEAGHPVVLMNSPIIARLYAAGMAGRPEMRAGGARYLPRHAC